MEQIQSMVPEEWGMRILEEGGVTTAFRSVWLLVLWVRLTRGCMILTPMTDHHTMHLSPCLNNLPILDAIEYVTAFFILVDILYIYYWLCYDFLDIYFFIICIFYI